jgi:hypothetical protein
MFITSMNKELSEQEKLTQSSKLCEIDYILKNVTAGVAGEFYVKLQLTEMSYRTRICRTEVLHARQWDEERLADVAVTVSTK